MKEYIITMLILFALDVVYAVYRFGRGEDGLRLVITGVINVAFIVWGLNTVGII